MLKDKSQSDLFRQSKHWKSPLLDFRLRIPQSGAGVGQTFRSNSLSGNERNRLVMAASDGFEDRTLISGLDCKEDARSFALFDYDRDGWVDIALASCNGPRLRLFRNRMAELGAKGRVVEVVLRGDARESQPSTGSSNRDAVGAILTAETSKGKRVYRKSVGEGLAAQNSERIRVPLADGEELKKLTVRWPSGREEAVDLQPGQRLFLVNEKP